ncbi:hypothetical protein Pla110_46500 [Polystyrenella longa]|uniref:LamG-like jellyroll fold domain-containing protein n=1 Tax=Polystyrenella longa TaxID=2528007 RepID=A0A518CUI6_9PLAN|nr:DUF1553 domain-containing protein [Polystyrenella longa]QDU82887.1 hypothetical protein Pla110_46500 [Polystyrenella longa]
MSRLLSSSLSLLIVAALALSFSSVSVAEDEKPKDTRPYHERVLADEPVVYWQFSQDEQLKNSVVDGSDLKFEMVGDIKWNQPGAQPEMFPLFSEANQAVRIDAGKHYVRVTDPGEKSVLDYDAGESITLEAWVNPTQIANGHTPYVIGKGRTHLEGQSRDNQNYALRLMGKSGNATVNFLFRSRGEQSEWHRWSSTGGFSINSGWHHIAITYTFGEEDSLRGYIDGKQVDGKWDYGGKTNKAPVVDDDELWIGSAQAGGASSSFTGELDEIAIYRKALTKEQVANHFDVILPDPYESPAELPADQVLVEIFENVKFATNWDLIHPDPTESYLQSSLVFMHTATKYDKKGLITDRSNPYLVRASTNIELPAGNHRFLLRSRRGSRLTVDGKLIAENGFLNPVQNGHNTIWEMPQLIPGIRPLQPGDSESAVEFTSPGGSHRIQLDFYSGGQGKRPDLGETFVSVQLEGTDQFLVLDHAGNIPLTNEAWNPYETAYDAKLEKMNTERRLAASVEYREQWAQRHAWIQGKLKETEAPEVPAETALPESNLIDRFINQELVKQNVEPTETMSDFEFVRRASLDVIGLVPTPEMIAEFFADQTVDRRANYLDRLLKHSGWADHWVSYWQDALAENPNVINPTLNNTGPFRYWLEESFRDNKPFDQLVTELVMMEGSQYYGGPAGFAIASQNDSPMAAKAHILGQAFLGMNMKCARCHDAPFHDFGQRDLFQMAAMLKRGPEKVPATSTLNVDPETLANMLIVVSIKPGEAMPPEWPFAADYPVESVDSFLQKPSDTREQLAWKITSPENDRFSKVIVNRVWHRLMGRGLVEPIDDWELGTNSHPELINFLAREFMLHGYDLKYITRLIMTSAAYQRKPAVDDSQMELFAGPSRRRMRAEQLVDSLFSVAGKSFNTEDMNIDVDGNRQEVVSRNFGSPERAWEFTSLSNERDRPSLTLPGVQTMINVLENFGWRPSRQDPLTYREESPSVLQSSILSNGVVAKRITQLSEDSRFTALAMQNLSVEEYVKQVYLTLLTREPTDEESRLFSEYLQPGFESRRIPGAEAGPMPMRPLRDGVSWSNHLKPRANELKIEYEDKIQIGDPPTTLLETDWRERAEDMLWALLNSPEFVLIP